MTADAGRARTRRRTGRAGVRRVRAGRARRPGGLDFDDLAGPRAAPCSSDDAALLARWRARAARPARRRGAGPRPDASSSWRCCSRRPANDVFLVGDDDQTIYWLAARRRAPRPGARGVAARAAPGGPRDQLPLPAAGRRRGRSGSSSTTASGSRSGSSPGRGRAAGSCSRRTAADDAVRVRRAMAAWPADDATRAVLARTNRELLTGGRRGAGPRRAVPGAGPRAAAGGPAARRAAGPGGEAATAGSAARPLAGARVAAVALLAEAAATAPTPSPRPTSPRPPTSSPRCSAGRRRSADARRRCARPSPPGAPGSPSCAGTTPRSSLATAHGTKGLEWDHVLVLDRRRSRAAARSSDATEPERALEEERRLAYVAWTRARRSLTLLYDPDGAVAVPARGVRPGRAGLATTALAAVLRHVAPVERRAAAGRCASRNGSVTSGGSDVPDRVLGPVRGPGPQRRAAQVREARRRAAGRAAARGRRPSGRSPRVARRGQQPVAGPRRDERGLVDRRPLVAGGAGRARPAAVATRRHAVGADPPARARRRRRRRAAA